MLSFLDLVTCLGTHHMENMKQLGWKYIHMRSVKITSRHIASKDAGSTVGEWFENLKAVSFLRPQSQGALSQGLSLSSPGIVYPSYPVSHKTFAPLQSPRVPGSPIPFPMGYVLLRMLFLWPSLLHHPSHLDNCNSSPQNQFIYDLFCTKVSSPCSVNILLPVL